MGMQFGPWDIALILAVTLQVAVVAYLYDPKWKAFALMLPVPFTLATMAVGKPIDASNVLGLVILLLFANTVRWLHYGAGLRIVASIILSAAGCCLLASAIAPHVHPDDWSFWLSSGGVLVLALVVLFNTPHVVERGHRTPLPIYVKLPGIAILVTILLMLKKPLGGFMTAFPMVTVFAAYESRYSLATLCRQIPAILLSLLSVMITIRLAQTHVGVPSALAIAWVVFVVGLIPMNQLTKLGAPDEDSVDEQGGMQAETSNLAGGSAR